MKCFTLPKYMVVFSFLFSLQYCVLGQTPGVLTGTNNEALVEARSKETDIKKLISAMGGEDLIKQTLPPLIAQLKQAMPQVSDEFWNEFQRPESIKQMMELYVRIYDRHFTHEEIKGMLDFYNTSLGKKMIATMPLVWQETMQAGKQWGTELADRIATNQPASNSSVIQRPFSEQDKRRMLKANGYDPDHYELDDNGYLEEVAADPRQAKCKYQ